MTHGKESSHHHHQPHQKPGPDASDFGLTSSSVEKGPEVHGGARFKRQCTGDGSNQSPQLSWHDAPAGTVTFALTVVDIDAPDPDGPTVPFTHWVLINIPASYKGLPEGFSSPLKQQGKSHDRELQEGVNDFKQPHYIGPAPPTGEHRYVITLYALDTTIDLGNKATKEKLEEAVEGHVLGEAKLEVRYTREKPKDHQSQKGHAASGWA